jgi:hypothetical protein
MRWRSAAAVAAVLGIMCLPSVAVAEDFTNWQPLQSSFPSTGGGGITIKGYDPVITGGKCVTTFMAVPEGADPIVYPNIVEFEAVERMGGTLCQNGKWRSFDGATSGTTPFRVFQKDGKFFRSP